MYKSILPLFILVILAACNQQQEQNPANSFAPKVVEAHGYVVPKDSVSEPLVIPIDESKLKKTPVGKPVITTAITNVHILGKPNVVLAGKPRVCIPGTDTFLLPKVNKAIHRPFLAGIPEVVVVKDAFVKDQNSQNFSSFSKAQGLKDDFIRYTLQDKIGNLWFGGSGGGVIKYDGKYFTNYTEKEGLSNNMVISILLDKNGTLWFGTDCGVSKYDGKYFTNYTKEEGLSNNVVLSILQDKHGNIWFGTTGGVCKYDGEYFTSYTQKEGLSNNNVLSILQDQCGNLWFGTNGGGVSKYDGKSFTNFTEKEGLPNNSVYSISQDQSGNYWFCTLNGVSKFDGNTFTNYTQKEGLLNNMVLSIFKDKDENLWFGTTGGVSKYDGKTFTNYTEKEGLSNNLIRSIFQDKSGIIWFSTLGGGVSRLNQTRNIFTNYTEKEGLPNKQIWSILLDKNGNLWFGGLTGGISRLNQDKKSFTNYTEEDGLSSNAVWSILQDNRGNLWFGTDGGGVSKLNWDWTSFTIYTEKDGLSDNSVRTIFQDNNGNLWFGTDGGGVSRLSMDGKSFTNYTKKEGLSSDIVLSMTQDKSGNLWFGTYGGGVSMLSEKEKYFTIYSEKEGLSSNTVRSCLLDKNGNLWFGTSGGGISQLSRDRKTFTNYTEKDGLSNNSVYGMHEDKNGNFWFGASFGLNKFKIENLKLKDQKLDFPLFKQYDNDDGFLGIGVNGGNTICEDNKGTIWIGSNDRLIAYHPDDDVPDSLPPNIQITGVALFNENIPWRNIENRKDTSFLLGNGVRIGDFKYDSTSKWYGLPENLSLAYNNNYVSFNFIGITTKSPKKVRYRYKLDGLDENWSALTDRNEAPYGNLPSGTYTFKVKAMNSEGYWSMEFDYTFTIRPPWWNTWWFRTIYITAFILSLLGFYYWRTATLRKRQKELVIKIREATTEIQQQKDHIEEIHKDLTDSINYAERIQRSFIATKELLDKNLKEYFVLFQPKAVVSGDFYWASDLCNSNFALATADSTGHGVPGAIMSILNITSLEKAVEQGLCNPSEILNQTRLTIIERLKKDGSAEGGKDGMDVSLICFDFIRQKFQYAAANNPVWIIRENKMTKLCPDKMPVGKHDKDEISFSQHEFQFQKGDIIYTFTDGLPDQFGGPKGKKYMYKRFMELLLANCSKTMHEQKEIIQKSLNDWMGENEQIDDITVLGIKL